MNNIDKKEIEGIKASIEKEWLTPNEINQKFGFSVSTLAKWRMSSKHLKFSKVGKYIKYKRSDIVDFLDAHSIAVVA